MAGRFYVTLRKVEGGLFGGQFGPMCVRRLARLQLVAEGGGLAEEEQKLTFGEALPRGLRIQ